MRGGGRIDVRGRRAVVNFSANALDGADTIRLSLDSRPDDGRFDIDAVATAPLGGVIAGLAGFTEPLALAIKGDGSWARWHGRLAVFSETGMRANVAIDAREGHYVLHGPIAKVGPLAGLGTGGTGFAMLDADLRLENRLLSGKASLGVNGLSLSARGGIDLARSAFDNLLVDARAADLARVAPNLAGRDAVLKARLSGPFAQAELDFLVTLAELRQGGFTVSGLKLSGEGRLGGQVGEAGGAWPIKLDIGAIRTANATLDARLRVVGAQGLVRLKDGVLRLEETRIRASGLDARLRGEFETGNGRLDLALTGSMNGLELQGLGRVDVDAVLRLARPPRGTLGFSGTARAAVQRLDNDFLRTLGDGLPVVTTSLALGPGGRLDLRNLRVVTPALTLAGEGYRVHDGTMHLTGSGAHRDYGPVALVLDGRIERPRVDLMLRRPGQGIGLADVHALLEPSDAGFNLTAQGQSTLGPFTLAGVVLLPPGGDVRIGLDSIRVADVVAKGTLAPATGA